MDNICSNCIFWRSPGGPAVSSTGECHRYPPQVVSYVDGRDSIDTTTSTEFPVTMKSQWCGEHRSEKL